MKKTILALAAFAVGASAYAQETKTTDLSVTLDLTYVTDYVFRGATLAGASFQPSVEAAYGDFYTGVWHSNAISGTNAGFDSETDFYAGYGFAVTEKISLDVGATRYVYSGGSSGDTTEAYAGVSFDVLLSPSVYYYHDFDLEISSYIGSIGYSLPIESIGTSLDFSGSIGYIQRSGLIGDDYTYGSVGVSVPYKLSETATLTAGVQYILNDTDALEGDNDLVVGSVGISIGF
jgi:uncharacterized protein (TIGR02001 family)